MQEEIENRTVNLAINTTKLAWGELVKGFQAWRSHHKAKKAEIPHGKQTIQQLLGQNKGVSSIPVESTDLKGFEKAARKYSVDFSIVKDKSLVPPRYTVFFKAQDADALTAAFTEFSNQKMKAKDRPSVLEQLGKLKGLVASLVPDKVREKSQERGSR